MEQLTFRPKTSPLNDFKCKLKVATVLHNILSLHDKQFLFLFDFNFNCS